MDESDRPALCDLLQSSADFPHQLLYLYQRPGPTRYPIFVASRGDVVDGMLTGSFDSNFHESGAFDVFVPPTAPHGYLDRIHVRESARRTGIGRALVTAYVEEAAAYGCTFIGGSVDLSSEATDRRAFFERLGFAVRDHDNFGARPSEILSTPTDR